MEIDLDCSGGDCLSFSPDNNGPHCYKTPVLLVPQALEDLHHGVSDGVDDFVVVVVEGHFDIQAHELGQVAVGVGILGPENWRGANSVQMRRPTPPPPSPHSPPPTGTAAAATRAAAGVYKHVRRDELAT